MSSSRIICSLIRSVSLTVWRCWATFTALPAATTLSKVTQLVTVATRFVIRQALTWFMLRSTVTTRSCRWFGILSCYGRPWRVVDDDFVRAATDVEDGGRVVPMRSRRPTRADSAARQILIAASIEVKLISPN